MLEQILEKEKTPVRETALITIGLLGKIAHRELQGKCVVWLFEALGQTNIFLKSLAYMQVSYLLSDSISSSYARETKARSTIRIP